jgi:K+-sensing histidine kinase KdpD
MTDRWTVTAWAGALAAPLVLCLLMSQARDVVPPANAILVLVLVVVAVAATGSRSAGVVAALSCTTWFDFFLLEPYLTFTIGRREDVETAVLLTLVGLGVTEIALWGRRQQGRASRGAGYLDGVVSAAGAVAEADAGADVRRDLVARQIAQVLGADACRYVAGPPSTAHPQLLRDGTVRRGGHEVDVDRVGLPTDDVLELPVTLGGITTGRFVVTAATRRVWPSLDQRRVAVVLGDLAGGVSVPPRTAPAP